jgi:ABC-type transporter Mla MlaB component
VCAEDFGEPADRQVTVRLEGKVVGPWVEECDRAWQGVRAELGSKKLRLDLCGLSFMDAKGTALLREIYRTSRAEILADTPLTKYFAERIAREAESTEDEGV